MEHVEQSHDAVKNLLTAALIVQKNEAIATTLKLIEDLTMALEAMHDTKICRDYIAKISKIIELLDEIDSDLSFKYCENLADLCELTEVKVVKMD